MYYLVEFLSSICQFHSLFFNAGIFLLSGMGKSNTYPTLFLYLIFLYKAPLLLNI